DRLALLENQSALQARTIGAARVQTTEQSTQLSDLADQLSRLEQQTVLQARTLGAARAQVQEDQTTIQSLTQERDGLRQSLKVLEPQALLQAKTIGAARRQVAASAAELAELTKAKDALEAQLDDLTAQSRLQAKTIGAARVFATQAEAQRIANAAELERLAAQVAALAPQAVLQAKTIGAARVQTARLESELAELSTGVATRDAEITALAADLASNQAAFRGATRQYQAQRARIAELLAEVDLYQERASAARTDLDAMTRLRDDLAAVLKRTEEDLEEASTAATLLGDMQTRLAEVTRARNISERKVGILDTRIARLETSLVQAEALADAPQTEAMASCNALAERMLEGSRINFLSSSATITLNSVPLLERLTGIALACVTTGGTLEIGGHTDSRGSDSANQALSEERAQAVRTFMIERGINAGRLNAVGFGESQPVADNETAEGQAANRRISFTWRQE
ncbi:MAG: OmpA family protein, partial [Pseudomonadota bacterium]